MRFTTARLCGGEALMAVSADPMDIDVPSAADRFESEGFPVTSRDELMCVFQWNGMETTLYRQGKIMFFPLKDRQLCIKYATELLEPLAAHSDRSERPFDHRRTSAGLATINYTAPYLPACRRST